MNGTRKFSDVAKEALGLELLKGISTVDVRVILEKLVTKSNGDLLGSQRKDCEMEKRNGV